jgi:hypothetical protein
VGALPQAVIMAIPRFQLRSWFAFTYFYNSLIINNILFYILLKNKVGKLELTYKTMITNKKAFQLQSWNASQRSGK